MPNQNKDTSAGVTEYITLKLRFTMLLLFANILRSSELLLYKLRVTKSYLTEIERYD